MNYQDYYNKQVTTGLPGFQGAVFQKGYRVGSIFKRFFMWVIPIKKDNALPLLNKTIDNVKEEAISGLSKFADDVVNKEMSIKESGKLRLNESLSNLKRKIQEGSGKNPKKIRKTKCIRKSKCIFD